MKKKIIRYAVSVKFRDERHTRYAWHENGYIGAHGSVTERMTQTTPDHFALEKIRAESESMWGREAEISIVGVDFTGCYERKLREARDDVQYYTRLLGLDEGGAEDAEEGTDAG